MGSPLEQELALHHGTQMDYQTVRKSTIQIDWPRWTKLTIAISAIVLLSSYTPVPGLIHQIKSLGELRVVTRTGPLAFYRGPDGAAEGPEFELARRFADELGVKLKITPMRTYAEIYAALTSGQAHLAAAGLKVPTQAVPGIEFGPAYGSCLGGKRQHQFASVTGRCG